MSQLFRNAKGSLHLLGHWCSSRIQIHIGKRFCKINFLSAIAKSTGHAKENGSPSANPVPFSKMMKERREEAERSVLVQVHSEYSSAELVKYCLKCGDIKGMHHYSLPGSLWYKYFQPWGSSSPDFMWGVNFDVGEICCAHVDLDIWMVQKPNSHFIIVEFNHASAVNHLLDDACCFNSKDVIPVKSPFLWFRAPKRGGKSKKQDQLSPLLFEVNGNTLPTQKEIRDLLQAAETLSDQILILHRTTCLGDLGSRLRFFAARQIELALKGLFPDVSAFPFGSSVNGFGRALCDLDLVLLLNKTAVDENEATRLIFHAKTALANERTQVQRHMETLADVCQFLLPGCSNVRRILNARVPIVKYHQDFTGLEIDLSMTNMTAVYMSELLYIFGELDCRVRPLASAIKYWAREVGITNPTPGRWITNFSLMLLILFYLQQQKPAVLPTANALMATIGSKDKQAIEQGRKSLHIPKSVELALNKNTADLESLFLGFFEFYASFEFDTYAISICNGNMVPKPEHSALYIVNPLEQGLNVSKNVSHEEVERFRIELRNAAWILESTMTRSDQDVLWGLNSVFQTQHHTSYGRDIFRMPPPKQRNERLMDLSDIFQSEGEVSGKTRKSTSHRKRTAASDVKRR